MNSKTSYVFLFVFFALGPLASVAPLGLAPLLHFAGLASLITYRLDHKAWPVPKGIAVWTLALLMGFITLSCLWSFAGSLAWQKLPEILAMAASSVVIPIALRDLPLQDLHKIKKAFLVGIITGLAALFGDILLGSPIMRLHKPWADIPLLLYDRSIIALGLFLWPAILILFQRGYRRGSLLALVAYTVAILFLQSHSAMVGMSLGLIVLGLAVLIPQIVRYGLIAICGLGFLCAVPIAFALYQAGLADMSSLQFSFRDRVGIWHFTAERILHHPIFGLGFNGSRAIPVDDLPFNFLPFENNKPPLHPHNVFLQIWLELGAIGAVLSLAFMSSLINQVKKLPRISMNFSLAAASCFIAIASFAFGIWQGWWLATLSFLISSLILASKSETLHD